MSSGGSGSSDKYARLSYQLQVDQFNEAKKQIEEMKQLELNKDAKIQDTYQQLLKRKQTGRGSTMLTDPALLGSPLLKKSELSGLTG